MKNVSQELLANPSLTQYPDILKRDDRTYINSKSIHPLKTVFSRRLAVIVGAISTGTIFSTALFFNQKPQLVENTFSNPIPTKITPTLEPNSEFSLTSEDYYRLGKDKSSKKEYEEAIQYFNKAIELNDRDPYYYSSRGFARTSSRDYKEALNDYDEAIKIGECGCFFEKRAEIYKKLGDRDKASGDYQSAVHLYNKKGEKEKSKEAQKELDKVCQDTKEDLRGCLQS
ncbi:MAG: tetratricopeptide repeat protein [Nostocales cyanobacterium 94392]|nr:tetratricopeptide repeat protein [Nostocales cyanobacterium 94392]